MLTNELDLCHLQEGKYGIHASGKSVSPQCPPCTLVIVGRNWVLQIWGKLPLCFCGALAKFLSSGIDSPDETLPATDFYTTTRSLKGAWLCFLPQNWSHWSARWHRCPLVPVLVLPGLLRRFLRPEIFSAKTEKSQEN